MNFYIADPNPTNRELFAELIEHSFDNYVVGQTASASQAYLDLLELRVDIMIVSTDLTPYDGIELVRRLKEVNSRPRFILTGTKLTPARKEAAYKEKIDIVLNEPLQAIEVKHILQLIGGYVNMTNRLAAIYELALASPASYQRPQSAQRKRIDHVNSVLMFLGIAAETGSEDIRRIVKLMVDQNVNFASINFERDLQMTEHDKKVVFQRIRRSLKAGITNLATMCIDYPENEILLEYANNLFEYQNVHSEMQRQRNEEAPKSQISLQHFFDGLWQESFRS